MRQKISPTSITSDEQVTYYLMDEKEALEDMRKTINQVNEVLGLESTTSVRLILNHFKWDQTTLIEKFYEDSDALFKKLGLTNPYLSPSLQWDPCSPAVMTMQDPFSVAIQELNNGATDKVCRTCCTEQPASEIHQLRCRHQHCISCWQNYLESKIAGNSCGQGIFCPSRCRQIIDDEGIFQILANNEKLRQRYQRYLVETYVEANRLTRWCSGGDCNTIVKLKSYTANCTALIECDKCQLIFCFHCGKQWHEPIQCSLLQKWEIKNQDESMTGKWLIANTKECPKCHSSIEKNGGCNHMTCRKPGCGFEFCWLCFGDWRNHSSCNVYRQPENEAAQLTAREALARYMHYFTRYQTHNQSLELEKQLMEKVHDRVREMEENLMSYSDRQAFFEACRVLQQCRRTLKYTYPFAYYLTKNSQAQIFEDNQADLERATEVLSGFLENEFEVGQNIPQKVMDKYRYCDQRRRNLLKHCKEGYRDRCWEGLDPY